MGFQRECVWRLEWLPRDGLGGEDGGGLNQSLKQSKHQWQCVCVCVCVCVVGCNRYKMEPGRGEGK